MDPGDYEQMLVDTLRKSAAAKDGSGITLAPNAPTGVQVGQPDDYEAGLVAKLRSEALTDGLTKRSGSKDLRDKRFTPDLQNAPFGAGSSAEQVPEDEGVPGYSRGEALLNGVTLGAYPQLYAAGSKLFGQDYSKSLAYKNAARDAFIKEAPLANASGEILGSTASTLPLLAAGQEYALAPLASRLAGAFPKMAGTIADLLASAGKVGTGVSNTASGAVQGGAGSLLTSGLSDKPTLDQVKTGALIGAPFNVATAPALKYLFGQNVGKATAENAQALINQVGPDALPAGKIPGAPRVTSWLDKTFGGHNQDQQGAFWNRATDYAPNPTHELTSSWVADDRERIGKEMNDIQSAYSIPAGAPDAKLDAIATAAQSKMSVQNASKVQELVDKVKKNTNTSMTGEAYKDITGTNGLLDNYTTETPAIIGAARNIRGALNDAWRQSLPEDKQQAWDWAQEQYKRNRTLADVITAKGDATGAADPRRLYRAVTNHYGSVDNAMDYGELAKGGQLLGPPEGGTNAAHGGPFSRFARPFATTAAAVTAGNAASTMGIEHASQRLPELMMQALSSPEHYAIPAMTVGTGLAAGGFSHWLLNRPEATQNLLNVAMGLKQPALRGMNPLLPAATALYNRE